MISYLHRSDRHEQEWGLLLSEEQLPDQAELLKLKQNMLHLVQVYSNQKICRSAADIPVLNLYICYYQRKGNEEEMKKRERERLLKRDTRVNCDTNEQNKPGQMLNINVPGPGC